MSRPDTLSMGELSALLSQRAEEVAHRYAPPTAGSHVQGTDYWTLNPGRADSKVGSFKIAIAGLRQGRWYDFAAAQGGDLIDLIQLSLNCDKRAAILEARAFLGLTLASPEVIAQRKRAAELAQRRAADRARQAAEDMEATRRSAHAMWLGAEAITRGSPVDRYLEGRGLDLRLLDRMPSSLRYLRDAWYSHTDPETGEVVEGRFPAMLGLAVDRRGKAVACHRTYLALRGGAWAKADVPKAKKVLGRYAGAAVRVWAGAAVDGRKPVPLAKVKPGTRVYIAEGIEDALSCAMVLPEARVLSAISLSNIGGVELPGTVSSVTLIGDRDESPDARAALDRAVARHREAGREVRLWQNAHGGKDLNDALTAARSEMQEGAA